MTICIIDFQFKTSKTHVKEVLACLPLAEIFIDLLLYTYLTTEFKEIEYPFETLYQVGYATQGFLIKSGRLLTVV